MAPGKTIGGFASFTDPSTPSERYKLGDVDNNDLVESPDIAYIQRKAAMMKVNIDEAIMLRNGDVDGNGLLEVTDATYIQRYLAHMSVKYPIGEYIDVA